MRTIEVNALSLADVLDYFDLLSDFNSLPFHLQLSVKYLQNEFLNYMTQLRSDPNRKPRHN